MALDMGQAQRYCDHCEAPVPQQHPQGKYPEKGEKQSATSSTTEDK